MHKHWAVGVRLFSPNPHASPPLCSSKSRSALLGSADNYLVCEEETASLLMFDTAELCILAYLVSAFHPDTILFAFTFSAMSISFISISFIHYFFFCTFFYSICHFSFCLPAPLHFPPHVSYRAALSQLSSLVD